MSVFLGGRVVGDFAEPFADAVGAPASWIVDAAPPFLLRVEHPSLTDDALQTPGGFLAHTQQMRRRDHHLALSALIAGRPGIASVRDDGSLRVCGGLEVETHVIRSALQVAARVLIDAGAKSVVAAADRYQTLHTGDGVESIPDAGLWTTLIYPIGGNALSSDRDRGVVGTDFRVHGHGNLYVCDASVLPASLDVDPQLTIMAFAYAAARHILETG
jgi:choline dehydrogenase-like flavoprotein